MRALAEEVIVVGHSAAHARAMLAYATGALSKPTRTRAFTLSLINVVREVMTPLLQYSTFFTFLSLYKRGNGRHMEICGTQHK